MLEVAFLRSHAQRWGWAHACLIKRFQQVSICSNGLSTLHADTGMSSISRRVPCTHSSIDRLSRPYCLPGYETNVVNILSTFVITVLWLCNSRWGCSRKNYSKRRALSIKEGGVSIALVQNAIRKLSCHVHSGVKMRHE